LTHGHLDHIGCVRIIQEKYNMNVYLHEDDIKLSKELKEYCDYFGMTLFEPPIITNIIKNEKNILINKLNIDIIHTPGHTAGGISYKIDNNLFVGDVLFNNSIGRTDLPGGDLKILLNSINKRLFILPDITSVYSGHGPSTTIGYERKNNQFLI